MARAEYIKYDLPDFLLREAAKIKKASGQLYLVGGAVRDLALGHKISDIDLVIGNISEAKFFELFPDAEKVGKSFPVYIIKRDSQNIEINLLKDGSIEEDLFRRDFTINSMAVNITEPQNRSKLQVIDPTDGHQDLHSGKIKMTGPETFALDPVRIYRAARFAARLDFSIEAKTKEYMQKYAVELIDAYPERVFEEFKKALLLDNASQFFQTLARLNLLFYHFQDLDNLRGVPQVKAYHPEGDVFVHTMMTLDEICLLTNQNKLSPEKKLMLRFAVLMHDIGKGATSPKNYPHHYNHTKLGLAILDRLAESSHFILPNNFYKTARLVIKHHMRINHFPEMRPGKVVRLFESIRRSPITVEEFVLAVKADILGIGGNHKSPDYLDHFIELYHKMYEKTGGEDIDLTKYTGEEVGDRLFQQRAYFIAKEKARMLD
ncbi:MAG: HD domain-containing protein [Bacillota bacterium]